MTVDKKVIQITLEDFEIDHFWNLIAFALDLDAEKHCLTSAFSIEIWSYGLCRLEG